MRRHAAAIAIGKPCCGRLLRCAHDDRRKLAIDKRCRSDRFNPTIASGVSRWSFQQSPLAVDYMLDQQMKMERASKQNVVIAVCGALITVPMIILLGTGFILLPAFFYSGEQPIMAVRIAGKVAKWTGSSVDSVLRTMVLTPAVTAVVLLRILGYRIRMVHKSEVQHGSNTSLQPSSQSSQVE